MTGSREMKVKTIEGITKNKKRENARRDKRLKQNDFKFPIKVKDARDEVEDPENVIFITKISGKYEVDFWKLIKFINKELNVYQLQGIDKNEFIIVKNNIAKNLSITELKHIILDYIKSFDNEKFGLLTKEEIITTIVSKHNMIFHTGLLEFLPFFEKEFLRDTSDTIYFVFWNCYCEITANKIVCKDISTLTKPIHEVNIIDHNYTETKDEGVYADFMGKVSDDDIDRKRSLRSIMGYLISEFKDPAACFAVIFLDEKKDYTDLYEANGSTGKSLLALGLSKVRKTGQINGKNAKTSNQFWGQTIDIHQRLVNIDDVTANFDFTKIFNWLTGDLEVHRKNKDPYIIPFDKSPKVIISTNYYIQGRGSSFRRRKLEFELSSYFNENHSVYDKYGELFFDEWSDDEWNRFYYSMMLCAQEYLQNGIIRWKSEANINQILVDTNSDFYEFAEEYITTGRNHNAVLYDQFTSKYRTYSKISKKLFAKWIRSWANFKNWSYERRKSNGRVITYLTDENFADSEFSGEQNEVLELHYNEIFKTKKGE